jgi:hypothetical protein
LGEVHFWKVDCNFFFFFRIFDFLATSFRFIFIFRLFTCLAFLEIVFALPFPVITNKNYYNTIKND